MRISPWYLAPVLLAVGTGFVVHGTISEGSDLMERLVSEDAAVRREARHDIWKHWGWGKSELIRVAGGGSNRVLDQKNPDAVAEAMRLLGRMRVVQAVQTLAYRIEFRPHPPFPSGQDFFRGHRPAVDALIRIGKLSVPAVFEMALSTDEDEHLKRRLAAEVIEGVLGTELAKVYLERKLEQETDPVRQKRIQDLLGDVRARSKIRPIEFETLL